MSEQQKISSPTFDHYDSFTTADLQDLLGAWQWIGSNSGWAEWHEYAVKFISELEVELQQREGDR